MRPTSDRRRAHRGRGLDRAAASGKRGRRGWRNSTLHRRDRDLHHARLPLPRRRFVADQFPFAAFDAVHAGGGLQLARHDAPRLCAPHPIGGGRIVAVGSPALRLLESAAGEDGAIQPFTGETAIFITPGYRFRAVDLLLTNFHLPRSTLFMLAAAFSGLDTMRRAYAHAI